MQHVSLSWLPFNSSLVFDIVYRKIVLINDEYMHITYKYIVNIHKWLDDWISMFCLMFVVPPKQN